jgi:hypothetical protein
MKLSACALLLVSLASILGAQEPNRYGSVGVAGVVRTAEGKDETFRLATQVSEALRKDGNLTVRGEVQLIDEATDSRVTEVARRLAIDWLALVRFDPKDKLHGVFTVEVVHIVAQKVTSRAVALFGLIRTTENNIAADLASAANRSKDALTALVTQAKRIWVVLNLLTNPSEADFVFGASSNRTNKDGVGRWEGTLPPGPTKLRVLKQPDYAERVFDIIIPSTPCSPCYLPYQRVYLTKAP